MTRILFIDDDVLALQLMSKVTSLLGFQAILSTSPRGALDLVASERPELVVVDMMMDEMDGPEFVREMRQMLHMNDVPVVIYSAGVSNADEEKARSSGADGYLRKPVGLKELSQAVQQFTMQL